MCLAGCGGLAALSCFIPFVNPPEDMKSLIYEVTTVNVDKLLSIHFHDVLIVNVNNK